MNIFISYSHDDRSRVEPYVEKLKKIKSIKTFWDKDILAGQQWLEVLTNQVTASSVLVVFISDKSINSKFVLREVSMVDAKEGAQIVPIFLDPVENKLKSTGLGFLLTERVAIKSYSMDFNEVCESLINALPQEKDKPSSHIMISVMGAKGGTGKGTFVDAASQLVASTGTNVLIIDADLETGGFTIVFGNRAKRKSNVWSMLDAAYERSHKEPEHRKKDMGLWDITPPYLRKPGFGRIYLIPGRLASDSRPGWDALADIPQKDRSHAALEILEEACARCEHAHENIGCILIDCGAENNPLVSAGFVLAHYGYLVASPSRARAGDIPRWNEMHRQRYPEYVLEPMHIIVNQAQFDTPLAWGGVPGSVSFLPEDSTLRSAAARGDYDFELTGLNSFFLAVLDVLQHTFSSEHQFILPDEVEIWVRPWMKQLIEKKVPQRLMKTREFIINRVLGFLLPILGIALVVGFATLNLILTKRASPREMAKIAIIQLNDPNQANDLKDQIHNGVDFEKVATDHSLHSESKISDGLLPNAIPISDAIPDFGEFPGLATFLKTAEAGSVSPEIYRSGDFLYLVKLQEKSMAPPPFSYSNEALKFSGAVGIIAGFACIGIGIWIYLMMRRRRLLLMEIIARGEDKNYLEHLLRHAQEKGALKWLKTILNKELSLQKMLE